MVKIDRTPLPLGISITKDEDYRNPPVFSLLVADAHNKCYLCEIEGETDWEVEHRQSRKNFSALQHDWKNLFLSCTHCNGIKLANYDNIIDCTIVDPENFISFSITNINTVTITGIGTISPDIAKTIDLLNKVYNGIGRCQTDVGCSNLRNKVMKEVSKFHELIDDYNNEVDTSLKRIRKTEIEKKIQRYSAFAAFKRLIIRNDVSLFRIFGAAL
jgi:hypothetical protein